MLKNSAGRAVLTKPNPKRSQGRGKSRRQETGDRSKRQREGNQHRTSNIQRSTSKRRMGWGQETGDGSRRQEQETRDERMRRCGTLAEKQAFRIVEKWL